MTNRAENKVGRDNILFCIMANQSIASWYWIGLFLLLGVKNLLDSTKWTVSATPLVMEMLIESDEAANVECHTIENHLHEICCNKHSFFDVIFLKIISVVSKDEGQTKSVIRFHVVIKLLRQITSVSQHSLKSSIHLSTEPQGLICWYVSTAFWISSNHSSKEGSVPIQETSIY